MSFVGNEMGQNNIINAKKYTWAGVAIFTLITGILATLIGVFRNSWTDFYTDKPEIKEIMLDVLPWILVGILGIDGLQGTINGSLKGIEK